MGASRPQGKPFPIANLAIGALVVRSPLYPLRSSPLNLWVRRKLLVLGCLVVTGSLGASKSRLLTNVFVARGIKLSRIVALWSLSKVLLQLWPLHIMIRTVGELPFPSCRRCRSVAVVIWLLHIGMVTMYSLLPTLTGEARLLRARLALTSSFTLTFLLTVCVTSVEARAGEKNTRWALPSRAAVDATSPPQQPPQQIKT